MERELPKVITDTMTRDFVQQAIAQEESAWGPADLAKMTPEERVEKIWWVTSTAHYLWRTSPSALKLVLDERTAGHKNVFVREDLAGLRVFLWWGQEAVNELKLTAEDFGKASFGLAFEPQMRWLGEADPKFPEALGLFYFRKRREFIREKRLIHDEDLHRYIKSPESEILGFGYERSNEDEYSSLAVERKYMWQALYNEKSKDLVYDLMYDIGYANSHYRAPIPPHYW